MKRTLLILILFNLIYSTHAQDIDAYISQIAKQINNVNSGKYEFQQELSAVGQGIVTLQITKVDSKGKSKLTSYQFNLADIDKNTVRTKTQKDVITVQIYTAKKQKLIKKTIDNEKNSYVNSLQIYATDIDNGRAIADNIKKAIAPAKKLIENNLSLQGYDDRLEWLQNNITDVDLGDKQFTQNFNVRNTYPGAISFNKISHSGKNEKNRNYIFNLSGLDPKHINFEIKGNIFALKIGTKHNEKIIKVIENNQPKSFTNKFTIVCQNIEQARNMQKVLNDIIPLAEKSFGNSLPQVENTEGAYSIINDLIASVEDTKTTYQQNFEGDCIVHFTQNIELGNKNTQNQYEFNWIDINKNQLKIKPKGSFLILEIKTKKGKKYIKYIKNGQPVNYTNSINIYLPEIDKTLIVQKTIRKTIRICNDKVKKDTQQPLTKEQALQILTEHVKNFENGKIAYEQQLKLQENNQKLHYKRIEAGGKTSKELIYEVNTKDLNPRNIEIKVSGKNINVTVKTNHLEKVIQYYKDGKIQAYQNKFEIPAPDIETARKISSALSIIAK